MQDVMKESASIAHTYARLKLANYQVSPLPGVPVCSTPTDQRHLLPANTHKHLPHHWATYSE